MKEPEKASFVPLAVVALAFLYGALAGFLAYLVAVALAWAIAFGGPLSPWTPLWGCLLAGCIPGLLGAAGRCEISALVATLIGNVAGVVAFIVIETRLPQDPSLADYTYVLVLVSLLACSIGGYVAAAAAVSGARWLTSRRR